MANNGVSEILSKMPIRQFTYYAAQMTMSQEMRGEKREKRQQRNNPFFCH
jgi:hypothetical protein